MAFILFFAAHRNGGSWFSHFCFLQQLPMFKLKHFGDKLLSFNLIWRTITAPVRFSFCAEVSLFYGFATCSGSRFVLQDFKMAKQSLGSRGTFEETLCFDVKFLLRNYTRCMFKCCCFLLKCFNSTENNYPYMAPLGKQGKNK